MEANIIKGRRALRATSASCPFYEGVEISNPISSLRDVGLAQFELSYPGVLSAPFVAWTFGGNNWTAVYVERLDALPVAINVKATDVEVEIALKCYTASAYQVLKSTVIGRS